MTNKTVKKAKAHVKKGIAQVGKAAANLKDDVKADMKKLKAKFEPNADVEKKADAKDNTEDARDTVESIFGVNAGIVWKTLNLNGPMTIDDLVKAAALDSAQIYGALGWLGRENKISLETRGKVRFFSLRS
jgi:DNA replication initiation complex subunit (GINS family)